MIIAEVRSRNVPVEVLCLDVQSEHVSEQSGERAGNIPRGIGREICWRAGRRRPPRFCIAEIHFISFQAARDQLERLAATI